jgi:MFS family permease
MGMIGAAIGLGFIVGPALSGFASANAGLPFWIAAGLALVNALLVFFFLPETRKQEQRQSKLNPMVLLITGWQKAIRYPVILRLVLINLLFLVAFASMESVFALFTQQEFHWDASQNAFIFTYIGIVMVIMQGGLVGLLVKRFGEKRLLLSGLAFLALGLLLLPLSNNLAFLVVAMGILAIGDGAVTPISSTLLSFSTPGEVQGEILGLSQGVGGLGRVFGPLLATTLFAWGGAWFSFGLAALLSIIALLLAIPHIPTPHQRNAEIHGEEIPATT